jgi:hypothetical protein
MRKQGNQSPATQGAYAFVTAPYQTELEFWPLYLLTHRVGLVALNTLINDPIAKVMCLFSWSMVALCAHSAGRPFSSTEVGRLQFALLASLVFIAGTSTMEAHVQAAAEDPKPSIKNDLDAIQVVQGLLLAWPVCYFAALAWRQRQEVRNASVSCWSSFCQSVSDCCHWAKSRYTPSHGSNGQRRPANGSDDHLSSSLISKGTSANDNATGELEGSNWSSKGETDNEAEQDRAENISTIEFR